MKTKVNHPDIRYNGILEKENWFDQLVNWFKKIVDWFWDNKFFISIFALLIIANIELITNPKIEKWRFDHHTWIPLVGTCVLGFVYGAWVENNMRCLSMMILSIVCLMIDSFYYYPLSISIGLVTGFFIREVLNPWFEIFSNGIVKTGP